VSGGGKVRARGGQLIGRVLDIGADPHDEPDLRIRKRTAVAAALALMAVAVVYGPTNLAVGQHPQAALMLVLFLAFGATLLVFRRDHHLAPLVMTMAAVGVAIQFVSILPGRGLLWGAPNLFWTILIPVAVMLFLGARAALTAFGVTVVAVVGAAVIDPFVRTEPPEPSAARLILTATSILGPAAVALGLVIFIDGDRVRAKAQSDALLLNVLPRPIADRLKAGELVIADHYDEVTVLFADLVGFTPFAAQLPPARVVALLNEVFSAFDSLAARFGLEKIKTIGDAYMVVAGVPEPRPDHASVILEMAIAMHALVDRFEPAAGERLQLRTGIASGPAVAGVIGHRKFSYDVWGDSVNLASRMESSGVPGLIQVASTTLGQCRDSYPFTPRDVEVKGIGPLRTYLLDPRSVDLPDPAAGESMGAR
jgi:guanylate cyclase